MNAGASDAERALDAERAPGATRTGDALATLERDVERRVARRILRSLAHAMGSPLNVILGRASLLAASTDSLPAQAGAREIEAQVRVVARLVERALRFVGEAPPPEPALAAAPSVLSEVAALLGPVAGARGVSLEVRPPRSSASAVERARAVEGAAGLACAWLERLPAGARLAVSLEVGDERVELTLEVEGAPPLPLALGDAEPWWWGDAGPLDAPLLGRAAALVAAGTAVAVDRDRARVELSWPLSDAPAGAAPRPRGGDR